MARKNILSGLLNADKPALVGEDRMAPEIKSAGGTRGLGALGAVTRSIDALAARADAAAKLEAQLAEGSVIVDIDPDKIERSFIADRLGDDEEMFRELVEAIRERGQDSPVLLRPHPERPGYYQTAFGHRRIRAAQALGIPVRAVVKPLTDTDHVIAQGQENSARADLSFIERAQFVGRLEELGFSREVMMASLGIDKTTLSKMLSVCHRIPQDILTTIRDAKGIGRDRWHELSTLFDGPDAVDRARHFTYGRIFQKAGSPEQRFQAMLNFLKGKLAQKTASSATRKTWARPDGAVKAKISDDGKTFTIALKAARAADFGAYLASRLDGLYEAFEDDQRKNGD